MFCPLMFIQHGCGGLEQSVPWSGGDFPANAKEMRSCSNKDNEEQILENEHSGYFHEHGKYRIVIVSEDERQKEEQKWAIPNRDNHHPNSFFHHVRHVPQRLCDGKAAVDRHGEEIGGGAIQEGEADSEKETSMGEVDCVEEFDAQVLS